MVASDFESIQILQTWWQDAHAVIAPFQQMLDERPESNSAHAQETSIALRELLKRIDALETPPVAEPIRDHLLLAIQYLCISYNDVLAQHSFRDRDANYQHAKREYRAAHHLYELQL